jgi:hypothetical protein
MGKEPRERVREAAGVTLRLCQSKGKSIAKGCPAPIPQVLSTAHRDRLGRACDDDHQGDDQHDRRQDHQDHDHDGHHERGVNKGKRKGRGKFPARQINRVLRGLRQAAVEVLVASPAETKEVL